MARAMAARRLGLPRAPESATCSASRPHGRRCRYCEPLLLRLPQLLGRDLDKIGAAHAQVEPLVADGAVNVNLHRVGKRPPLPAIVVGRQRHHAVVEPGELERSRADAAGRVFPSPVSVRAIR